MDARDPDAFRALYRTHHRAVCRYLAARCPATQVEDAAAETFLIAWRRADRVPDVALPWLLNVAAKVLANQRRTVERAEAVVLRLTAVARLDAPGVDEDVERRRHQRALLGALAGLRPADRELMLLHVWDDLRPGEIAVVCKASPVVVRARLSRARRRLERSLREHLDDDAATEPASTAHDEPAVPGFPDLPALISPRSRP